MATSSKKLQQFLDSLEPEIRKAFLEDVALIRYRSNIKALEDAISSYDIEAILYASGIRESQWASLAESLRATYSKSGAFAVSTDVPARFGMQFNMTNPRVTSWITEHSSQLVVEINAKQLTAIQNTVAAGLGDGRNPRSIALDIAGRVSQQTGRRSGGIIGLHDQFADYTSSARRELASLNGNYFTRTRRDKRFDSLVRKAMESGKPIPKETVDRIVNQYADRLLATRAETIARTEAMTGMNAASNEAMSQVVDEGLAEADAITEIWDAAMDSKTRPDHFAADGQSIKHGEFFTVGGYQMRFPGDSSMGAGADQTARCRCMVRREIDFSKTVL
jgi:hypothetical protein